MVLFGIGVGFASSQLDERHPHRHRRRRRPGVASGTNTTVRQVGLALGIATFASLLNTLTIRHATSALIDVATSPADVQAASIAGAAHQGRELHAAARTRRPARVETLRHIIESAVVAGARPALFFAAASSRSAPACRS